MFKGIYKLTAPFGTRIDQCTMFQRSAKKRKPCR